jgi:hypothetical protein
VLEEDNDSGYGLGKSNIVRPWKQKHGLQYYLNCHSSPDLASIENAWHPAKQYVKKFLESLPLKDGIELLRIL